jgi:hypothetical protein
MATITAPRTPQDPPTADELWLAYRKAQLHKIGYTLLRALSDPLLSHQLTVQAIAQRKHQTPCTRLHAQQLTERETA